MSILSVFKKQDTSNDSGKEKVKKAEKKQEKPVENVDLSAFATEKAVIVRPIITEKASVLGSEGKYAFRVAEGVSKQDVRKAVEKHFKVHVEKVNMVRIPSKVRMRGAIAGRISSFRKAYVFLREGESIDLTK